MRASGARIAALLAISSLLAAASGEWLARRVESARLPDLYSPFYVGPAQHALRAYRPAPGLGYEPIPGRAGHDSRGLRNREFAERKPAGVLRLMLAGDSLAQLYGETLQEVLDAQGIAAEVWNLGVAGYGLAQYARRLLTIGMKHDPDAVVLFHCLNDADPGARVPTLLRREGGYWAVWPPDGVILPLFELWPHSALYRLIAIRLTARSAARADARPALPEATARLEAVRKECRRSGVPVFSFVFPYLMPPSEYPSSAREGRRVLLRALSAAGVPFVDLHGAIPPARLRGLRHSPRDHIHMSPAGARIAMQEVSRALQRAGVLPLPPSLKES